MAWLLVDNYHLVLIDELVSLGFDPINLEALRPEKAIKGGVFCGSLEPVDIDHFYFYFIRKMLQSDPGTYIQTISRPIYLSLFEILTILRVREHIAVAT